MDRLTDIDEIITMLDEKTAAGVGRIKVEVTAQEFSGNVKEKYHLGRCDVGSPFATGILPNEEPE